MHNFPWALIAASFPFLASMGFTPGPNNILVASSGVNFGFRATIPHILGITVGYPVMLLLVGLGLARIFIDVPSVHTVLKYASIVYLLYLAWKIATAGAPAPADKVGGPSLVDEARGAAGDRPVDQALRGSARPLTFFQAAAFQWVNVKAWITGLSAVTTYTVVDATLPWQISAIAALAFVVTLGSVSTWTLFGHLMRTQLNTPARLRWFNLGMAALLIVSILPVLRD